MSLEKLNALRPEDGQHTFVISLIMNQRLIRPDHSLSSNLGKSYGSLGCYSLVLLMCPDYTLISI